ncbi:MAG: alcohol dehydrogenase catalytic domain-containing protein [Proteobacteria bacterium]|nr:alcohol dehydrogenase catalytic domain-containing protein [Pseudomonadota bacterium]
MKAVQVRDYGGSDMLALADMDIPQPGDGEALVNISRAGINFIDVYMRSGVFKNSTTYPNVPPFTPGMEAAGVIEATGPGVEDIKPGDRVAYCLSMGGYAEYACVPAWKLFKVPDGVPLDVAAALQLQGMTAHYLTHSLYPLKDVDSCLIHAGAGGMGQLAIQLAKMRGARPAGPGRGRIGVFHPPAPGRLYPDATSPARVLARPVPSLWRRPPHRHPRPQHSTLAKAGLIVYIL